MPKKIWEEYPFYRLGRFHANNSARTCFSSLKCEGLENIPKDGAVLLTANHCATLMDPLLILSSRRELTAFGSRVDLFVKPWQNKTFHWMRMVPFARERDGLKEVARNFEFFDEIIDCIGHGVAFALFPEGRHRPERGMLPVKKGVFKLAKLAVEKLPGQKVYVVPVGLDYEYFFRGYGRAVVRYGEAMELNSQFARTDINEAKLYQELCEELQSRILGLIGRIPERNHKGLWWRIPLAILSLPVFAVCAVGGLPIWLPYALIMPGIKDKAWSHTVQYALHFFLPLFWIFQWPFGVLLNFYRNIFEDLRR